MTNVLGVHFLSGHSELRFAAAMLFDTAVCRVYLHGYGYATGVPILDFYITLVLNDVVYVNATADTPPDANGFFTYILHPINCSATDFQYFDTYANNGESARLINYLQALTDGRLLFTFL